MIHLQSKNTKQYKIAYLNFMFCVWLCTFLNPSLIIIIIDHYWTGFKISITKNLYYLFEHIVGDCEKHET